MKWRPAVSEYIHLLVRELRPPVHQPPGVTRTLFRLYSDPPCPLFSGPLDDGNAPTLSSSLFSPPKYCYHIVLPSVPPLYSASHRPVRLIPSSSVPLISSSSVAKPSACCDTQPPNCCYYTQWCGRGEESHPQFLVAPQLTRMDCLC